MQKHLLLAFLFSISFFLQSRAQPTVAAPNPPTRNAVDVKSLFSGAYTNIPGTDWFPNWGQTTVVTDTTIAGNTTKKYTNLNYQGVQFASAVNVTAMGYLHLDIWTTNCASFDVYLINTTPATVEQKVTLAPTFAGWNSFDIALSQYNSIALASVEQFKFVGTTGSTIYLDNVYFYKIAGKPPVVSITSPANNSSYVSPATINITATASDSDGTVKRVAFYKDANLLGVDSTSPYAFTWNNATGGNYALTARATDNVGLITTSAAVNVVVTGSNGDGYCATATNLDYKYKATSTAGVVTFTFHPLTPILGCTYSLIYLRIGLTGGYSGYAMSAVGTDFIYTTAIADSTPVSIYFTYMVPSGGERNSSANPHDYKAGANCTGLTGIPTVNITAPLNNAVFTEPATILIKANATDNNGTVSRVDFTSGSTLIGSDASNPYTYNWTNVPAGNYTLAAKVTDNDSISTLSTVVKVIVNINNSMGFCGTIANGDYSYRAEYVNGNIVIIFHPLSPIFGSAYAFVYLREGLTGPYPGYAMTAIGSDFRYTKPVAIGTPTSIYFTYSVPSGGERTSLATPHSYVVGTSCLSGLPVTLTEFTGSLNNKGVLLKWSTLSEINNDYFLVEKSSDALTYKSLSKVKGNDHMSGKRDYLVLDNSPLIGANYYRLSQFDKDGKITMFGVVKINFISSNTGLIVFPNPINNAEINIIFNEINAQKKNITLMDMSGRIILKGVFIQQGNQLRIPLNVKTERGLYILQIEGFAPVKIVVN